MPPEADPTVMLLRSFFLTTMAGHYEAVMRRAEKEGWSHRQTLRHLCESEAAERGERRTARLLADSGLPETKTLSSLDEALLPAKVRRQLPALIEGGFVERSVNVLAFGLPGRGKTHIVCAIGHELIQRGYRVWFTPTYALVQRLLAAKRDLRLEKELAALDAFDAVILDDIGYVQQSRDEMEVLFTFLAERYERKSVLITSNLVFSEWNRIFKDPMTTAAAIDRLVHHATILEMAGPSIRAEDARKEATTPTATTRTTTTPEPQPSTIEDGETQLTSWGESS